MSRSACLSEIDSASAISAGVRSRLSVEPDMRPGPIISPTHQPRELLSHFLNDFSVWVVHQKTG
jgi:hypothetical protein